MKGKLLNKIIKQCGTPEDFVFEYINGASVESDICRMREYVRCINRIEKKSKIKK